MAQLNHNANYGFRLPSASGVEEDVTLHDAQWPQPLKQAGHSAKIAVPVFEGLQMLETETIIRCQAHESYTEIILTNDSRLMVSRLLKEYEHLLRDYNFLRIHNSCLINLRHVKKYIKGDGGYVVMINGDSCEVSRRKKAELLHRLELVVL